MAKQTGEYKITGTYDDVTYYLMDGEYYARKKSSLRGERVKRAKEFKRTMQSAHRLGRGSQLASKVYRSLPREEQVYALFTELKSIAIQALKEGKSEEEVIGLLRQRLDKEKNSEPAKAEGQKCAPLVKGLQKAPALFQVYGQEHKPDNNTRRIERKKDTSGCSGAKAGGFVADLRRGP